MNSIRSFTLLGILALMLIISNVFAGRARTCNGDWVILEGDPKVWISTISFPVGSGHRQGLDTAINGWNGMRGMWLEFDPTVNDSSGWYGHDNGYNEIVFALNGNVISGANAVATLVFDACFWWFESQHIQEFDIEFNPDQTWQFGAPSPIKRENTNFRHTATHELGHALGLLHFNDAMSVMITTSPANKAWYGGSAYSRVLPHPDDSVSARVLYPFPNTHTDIAISNFKFDGNGSTSVAMPDITQTLTKGKSFRLTASFGNLGNTYQKFDIHVYFSTNTTISTGDKLVSSGTGWGGQGVFHTFTWTIVVPSWMDTGDYYVGVILDPYNKISEVYEGNNATRVPGMIRVVP